MMKEIHEEEEEINQESGDEERPANPANQKLFDLRLRINEARKKNANAVVEENERQMDPQFEKKRKRKEWAEEQEAKKGTLVEKGLDEKNNYLNEPLSRCKSKYAKQEKKASKKKVIYGWDVFNQDSLYGAYKRRLKNMPFDKEAYEEQIKGEKKQEEVVGEDKLQRLVDDIDKQYVFEQ